MTKLEGEQLSLESSFRKLPVSLNLFKIDKFQKKKKPNMDDRQ